jgi:hypothetical protein
MGSAVDSVTADKIEGGVYAPNPRMGKRFLPPAEEQGREHDLGSQGLRDKRGRKEERDLCASV